MDNLCVNHAFRTLIENYIEHCLINHNDIFKIEPSYIRELLESDEEMKKFITLNTSNHNLMNKLINDLIEIELVSKCNFELICYILQNSTIEIIKHIIDKNMNTKYKNNSISLIHIVCQNSTFDIIKYIVEKGVDLEYASNDGYKPIDIVRYV